MENVVLALVLGAMVLLPLLEMLARAGLRANIPGSSAILQHLALVVTMLGAAVAAREGRLLVLSNVQPALTGYPKHIARWTASLVTAAVGMALAYGAWLFVFSEWEAGKQGFGAVPAWVVQWVMPVGFAAIALRSLWSGGTTHPQRAALAVFCAIC
ncbi:MAG: TRAP transporter small permease, partial [Burkholderiales bacterium]